MPKGPQGQKRPADAISRAVMVMKIATGECEEAGRAPDPKAIARGKAGGAKGGKARAASLSASERSKIATGAAQTRWSKKTKP